MSKDLHFVVVWMKWPQFAHSDWYYLKGLEFVSWLESVWICCRKYVIGISEALRFQKLKPSLVAHLLFLLLNNPDVELSAPSPAPHPPRASYQDYNGITLPSPNCKPAPVTCFPLRELVWSWCLFTARWPWRRHPSTWFYRAEVLLCLHCIPALAPLFPKGSEVVFTSFRPKSSHL